MASIADTPFTFIGLDVHKDSISAGILEPGANDPTHDKIFHDEPSIRRLMGRFEPAKLKVCYEAGPTGYGLARLHRAGELTAIRVPTEREEAVRDLCRVRVDAVIERRRARQRLGGFLLRHGRVYRDGGNWTAKHERWLNTLTFDEPAATSTFGHYRSMLQMADAALQGIDDDLAAWTATEPFAEPVARLAAYRGIQPLGALVLVAEVCDYRRFATAGAFMSWCGLVPSEYSSGGSTRRGRLTRAGSQMVRNQLIESAWAYQHRASVGVGLNNRQQQVTSAAIARSWAAQQRLCGKHRKLATRKDSKSVVNAAVARELAGFVWAEMVATD